jgi:hypothetical protein
MRVVTRNSVYSVKQDGSMFKVQRLASTWGQTVKARHLHYSTFIEVGVGRPLVTSSLRTTAIVAILPE